MQRQASFPGLPDGVLLNIFEGLFDEHLRRAETTFHTSYHLYDKLYMHRNTDMSTWPRRAPLAADYNVLFTCRRNYLLANNVLYRNIPVAMCIKGLQMPADPTSTLKLLGRPEDCKLWPFLQKLHLGILLSHGTADKQVVLQRTRSVVQALVREARLRLLAVVFVVPGKTDVPPAWITEAAQLLKVLRVKRTPAYQMRERVRVVVRFDHCDDEDDALCRELAATIKGDRD